MARASISQRDFKNIPVVGLVAESSGSAPGAIAGKFWYDTATGKMKFSNDGVNFIDPLARANHTGTQLANTISDFNAAVQAIRIDQLTAPSAPVNIGNQRLTSVAAPVSSSDAATKQYVDDARAGLSVKDPVRVVATTNVNTASPGTTIDGVTLSNGDRVLLSAQTTGTQNGLYIFNGSASAMTRSTDADATGEIVDGTMVAVAEGTSANKQFVQTATPAGAPGAWTQSWVVFTFGGQTYTADGNGIELSGTTFSVELADASLVKSASGLSVGLTTVGQGGTGSTTAAGARTNLSAAGKFKATLGAVTAGTPVTVTHNLNEQYPCVAVWDVDNAAQVDADVKTTDANNITITSALAFAANKLVVTVTG